MKTTADLLLDAMDAKGMDFEQAKDVLFNELSIESPNLHVTADGVLVDSSDAWYDETTALMLALSCEEVGELEAKLDRILIDKLLTL